MHRVLLPTIALTLLALPTAARAQKPPRTVVEKDTKTKFDAVLTGSSGAALVCTGAGCRKKTMFKAKVYALAHWIDAAGAAKALAAWKGKGSKQLVGDQKFFDAMCTVDVEKRFRLVLAREVTGKQVGDGFGESLPDSPQKKQFKALFRAKKLKVGDTVELRWLPGATIEAYEKGKRVGTIKPNPKFAADVWRMYFGKKLVDGHLKTMKKQMLSNVDALWDPPKAPPTSRPAKDPKGK